MTTNSPSPTRRDEDYPMSDDKPRGSSMASEPEISTGTSDASTPLCEWQRTWTGERLCDQPAAYRVVYEGCTVCPGDDCEGAGICVEHAAVERERATEVGLIGIRSVAS